MPRQPRNDPGDQIYHVINRANNRVKIFEDISDYELFESLLSKGVDRFCVKLYSHTIMPNHFHFVLHSEKSEELSRFMQWLGSIFTQRWHMKHQTTGTGHLFQGRFKSFPIKNGHHLLQVLVYVERNAVRAGLVNKAIEWRWSSSWIRAYGNKLQQSMLSEWPIEIPRNYQDILNKNENDEVLEKIRFSIRKDIAIGVEEKRRKGRPRKK